MKRKLMSAGLGACLLVLAISPTVWGHTKNNLAVGVSLGEYTFGTKDDVRKLNPDMDEGTFAEVYLEAYPGNGHWGFGIRHVELYSETPDGLVQARAATNFMTAQLVLMGVDSPVRLVALAGYGETRYGLQGFIGNEELAYGTSTMYGGYIHVGDVAYHLRLGANHIDSKLDKLVNGNQPDVTGGGTYYSLSLVMLLDFARIMAQESRN